MEVTEVRVSLRPQLPQGDREARPGEQRLKAYATITFDNCFVVRNIKIIEGRQGLFVAMPSHKAKMTCLRCQFKNDVGGRFCVQCGTRFAAAAPSATGEPGEISTHRDIAHPITAEFRHYLQQRVLEIYEAERGKLRQQDNVAASAT